MRRFLAGAGLVLAVVAGVGHVGAGPPAADRPVVLEGVLAMSIEDDFQSGRATRRYFLDQISPARRLDLRLTSRQANAVQPGMRIRVTGRLAGSVLTADEGDESVVVLGAPSVPSPRGTR